MNCLTCSKESLGIPTQKPTYRICKKCVTRYLFALGRLKAYAITGRHNGVWYVGEFTITDPVQFRLLDESAIDGKDKFEGEWGGEEIVKMDYLPKINRDNFESKIPTLITFS